MKNTSNWKLFGIIAAGVIAVILLCVFAVQGAQNKAYSLEEQVNTAESDIKVQEKRRVDLVYNLADCVMYYDKHESETLIAEYRSNYNKQVKEFNRYVRKFPTRWFLDILGYEAPEYQYLDYNAPVDAPQNLFGN